MSLPKSLYHFQARTFARNAQTLSGEAPLQDFPRVLAETAGDAALRDETLVAWALRGEQREGPEGLQSWLLTDIRAHLYLPCQRCLQPVPVPVQASQWFRFVETEEQADQEDADADEDVLTFQEAENAHALLEDDLLMALPMAVVHDACPVQLPAQAEDASFALAQQERKNPFASLASLRLPSKDEPAD